MTTEEKAKAYDEALERAKEQIKECGDNEGRKKMIRSIFPELRESESEDERIRKWLVDYFSSIKETVWIHRDISCEQILAYLEKQKYDRMEPIYDARESFESALEKAWNDYHNGYENVDRLEDDYVECAHAKGFREGYLFGIEKQKEPEHICDSAQYEEGFKTGLEIGLRKQKEQKPAWSEEDQLNLNWVIAILNGEPCDLDIQLESLISWLKSLRPQPKQEWSEEDENVLKYLHDLISWGYAEKFMDAQTAHDMRVWINERLRHDTFQNGNSRWKPSEDEERLINTSISFLKDFADKRYENAVECIDWLKSKLNGNSCK